MKKHKYHFIGTNTLKKQLNKIEELHSFSFSGKINYILGKIDGIFKLVDYLNIDEESKVENQKDYKNIQLYIHNSLFKGIKNYHGKFNSYSIAKLLRMIIRLFIKMNEMYGFHGALKKLKIEIKNLKKINSKDNKKLIIVQLVNYLGLRKNKNLKIETILIKLLL